MIEIRCTKEEKAKIINAFWSADFCESNYSIKCYSDKVKSCKECLEKNIKWLIKE